MFDNPEFYKNLIDNLYEGVYFVDQDRKIIYWNKSAELITGYKSEQVTGHCCRDNILNHVTADGTLLCVSGCPLAACMDDGKPREAEVFLHHHDGHRLPVKVRASPIRDKAGEIIGAVETFSNNEQVLRNRRKVDELYQSAYIDPLTGVGNRRYLEDGIMAAKTMADRGIGIAGLILIDVDNLKYFNDTYGHMIGDQILKMVVQTLKHSLRSIDLLGRWGGDEFIAIVQDVKDLDTLQKVANKLRLMVENSNIDFEEGILSTTISIGATLVNVDESPEIIFQRADQLLYESKQAGKNKITVK